MSISRILVVRLGAMGDILHALPAAATLKRSFPEVRLTWAVNPKWCDLFIGGGLVDTLVPIDRRNPGSLLRAWRGLRHATFDVAIDFQGLLQSSLVATAARAARIVGFERVQAREPASAIFYTETVHAESAHVVDRNLELAAAAGALSRCYDFPLPPGRPEGALPGGPFVLASPLAGWASKQWPLDHYTRLAKLVREEFGMPLVLNGAPSNESQLRRVEGVQVHISSVAGLIDATRRAAAVIGLDSGPMHLAAALDRPGVALFGPTDPRRNGPYSKSFTVLRSDSAVTTYKRDTEIGQAMREIAPTAVIEALRGVLALRAAS